MRLLVFITLLAQPLFSFAASPTNLFIAGVYPAPFINGKQLNIQCYINSTNTNAAFTGLIFLFVDDEVWQNASLVPGSVSGEAVAYFNEYYLAGGNRSLKAVYYGDANFESSNSSSQEIFVGPAPTTISNLDTFGDAQINSYFDLASKVTYPGTSALPLGHLNGTFNITFYKQGSNYSQNQISNLTYWIPTLNGYSLYLGTFLLSEMGKWTFDLTLFGNKDYAEASAALAFTVVGTELGGISIEPIGGALVDGKNASLLATVYAYSQIPLQGMLEFYYPDGAKIPFCTVPVNANTSVNGSGTAISIPYPFQYSYSDPSNWDNYLRVNFSGLNYTNFNDDILLDVRPVKSFLEFDVSMSYPGPTLSYYSTKIHLSGDTAGVGVNSSYVVLYVNGKIVQANVTVDQRCYWGQDTCFEGIALGPTDNIPVIYGINEITAVFVSENITFNQSYKLDTCQVLYVCDECSQQKACGWCGNNSYLGGCYSPETLSNNGSNGATCYGTFYLQRCPAAETGHIEPNILIVIIVVPVVAGVFLFLAVFYYIYRKHFWRGESYARNTI